MKMIRLALLSMVAATGLVGACRAEAPSEGSAATPAVTVEVAPTGAADWSPYSPWAVEVEGVPRLSEITFKDVGLSFASAEEAETTWESLALVLAEELMSVVPDYRTAIRHDVAIQDPAWHTMCGEHHVYVDLWRSESPDRWGYSLWSGCDEDAQFAWREVPISVAGSTEGVPLGGSTHAPPAPDPLREVASSLVADLAVALETGCMTRHC